MKNSYLRPLAQIKLTYCTAAKPNIVPRCIKWYNINAGRSLPGPRVSMNGISLLSQIDLMWSELRSERGPRTAATPLERT